MALNQTRPHCRVCLVLWARTSHEWDSQALELPARPLAAELTPPMGSDAGYFCKSFKMARTKSKRAAD